MELAPYVDTVRSGVANAAALADDHTRHIAERLGSAIDSSTRLALIQALSDAASTISADIAPSSVELKMVGQEPQFAVSVPAAESAPTYLMPEQPVAAEAPDDTEEEPLARITLRLPQSVKNKIDELAAADGISTNAWLLRRRHRRPGVPRARATGHSHRARPCPPSPGVIFGPQRTVRPARRLRTARPVRGGRAVRRQDGQASERPGRARPRPRPGMGPMSFRDSVHHGVRRVVVDNLGEGSITVAAQRTSPIWSSARLNTADEEYLRPSPGPPGQRHPAAELPATASSGRLRFDLRLRVPAGPGVCDQGRLGRHHHARDHRAGPRSAAAPATSPWAEPSTWSARPVPATSRSAPPTGSAGRLSLRLR